MIAIAVPTEKNGDVESLWVMSQRRRVLCSCNLRHLREMLMVVGGRKTKYSSGD